MKREYTYCILSLCVLLLGITFTISGFLLKTIPHSSRSALLLFSISFMIVGIVAYAVHHKKYVRIKELVEHQSPILAHWTYDIKSSTLLKEAFSEQKTNSISTAILSLVLAVIFSIVFAYSGSIHTLYTGYILAILSVLSFLIVLHTIFAYYKTTLQSPTEVIFGEDCIYFMDQLYTLQKSIYFLENVTISKGLETAIQLIYGQYDVDDTPIYTISIPIPTSKLSVAQHLCRYYVDLIKSEYED